MNNTRHELMRTASWAHASRGICFVDPADPAAAGDPPADPAADPVAASDLASAGDPADPAPAVADPAVAAAAKPAEDWRDKRIATLTARLRAAEVKPAQPAAGVPPSPADATTDFNARVTAEAARLAEQAEFNRATQAVVEAGKVAFPDWDSRIGSLQRLVDPSDPVMVGNYLSLVNAAMETGKAHEILHALGSDLNEANRLLSLPPVKLGVAVAQMASGAAGGNVSRVPKPIEPVGSRGRTHEAIDPTDPDKSDRLTTAEWMKRMDERDAKRVSH